MVKKYLYSIILLSILTITSCKKEDGEPAKFYYNYFPDNVGHWVQYDIMEIVRDDISAVNDTTTYQLKEIIESTFIDNQGRPSLRIERYWRTNDTLPWTIKDVWYATRTTTKAEKVEEDIRYLKMVFAVTSDKRWDGNIYNTKDEETYKYDQLHEPMTIGNLSFDSTVTVIQRDASNVIEISQASEIFAANVGLISKTDVYYYINYINTVPNYIGYAFYQNVTNYGN